MLHRDYVTVTLCIGISLLTYTITDLANLYGSARREDSVIMTSWHSVVSFCFGRFFSKAFSFFYSVAVSTNLFKLAQVMQHKVKIAHI